jgi:hypothetical protein
MLNPTIKVLWNVVILYADKYHPFESANIPQNCAILRTKEYHCRFSMTGPKFLHAETFMILYAET